MIAAYQLGEYLRSLRKKRKLTQQALAERACISLRTLQYWESDKFSPRRIELESVLAALAVTPQEKRDALTRLTTPRGLQMVREADAEKIVDLGLLPTLGDLLRAMRQRRGWTQEHLAAQLGVRRVTINRWEATTSLPSVENIERLCPLLRAYPEEKASLQLRRLSLPHGKSELSWENCLEQLAQFEKMLWNSSLVDLYALALKRQLRLLLPAFPAAWNRLAWAELQHAAWLNTQERNPESYILAARSLAMLGNSLPEDPLRYGVLNLVASHINRGPRGYAGGIALQAQWLPRLSGSHRIIPLCDTALYLAQMQRWEEVKTLLGQTRTGLESEEATLDHWGYYQTTHAQILRMRGKPVEAMDWLPPITDEGTAAVSTLLLWSGVLLDAGDRDTSARYLHRVSELLAVNPRPTAQRRWEALTQRL